MRFSLTHHAERIAKANRADAVLLLEDETLLRDTCDIATASDFDAIQLDLLVTMVATRLQKGQEHGPH